MVLLQNRLHEFVFGFFLHHKYTSLSLLRFGCDLVWISMDTVEIGCGLLLVDFSYFSSKCKWVSPKGSGLQFGGMTVGMFGFFPWVILAMVWACLFFVRCKDILEILWFVFIGHTILSCIWFFLDPQFFLFLRSWPFFHSFFRPYLSCFFPWVSIIHIHWYH